MLRRGNTRYKNPQLVAQHEQICCVTSCEFDEKRATNPKFVAQSRPALYFSQQISSTCKKCFCCATSWSCMVKNGKHRPKLATKQCCATSWRFLYLVFRRLWYLAYLLIIVDQIVARVSHASIDCSWSDCYVTIFRFFTIKLIKLLR